MTVNHCIGVGIRVGHAPECDVPVPGIPVPGNCSLFLMVSEPVSEKFGTEKSPGTGLENIW